MSLQRPKVSVAIPTYNYGHYIGQTIQSVLDQTFKDFEVIVVDNCSSDKTEEVVRRFRDSRISYHRNPHNVGFARNLNKCVELARGEYISILHADDAYLPQILEIESGILDAHQRVGFVYAALYTMDSSGNSTDLWKPFVTDHIWEGLEEFKQDVIENYIHSPTVMVRRQCYRDVGEFDLELDFASDWDMWLRIALRGYQVAYVAKPLSYYRIHSESGTSWLNKEGLKCVEDCKVLKQVLSSKEIHNLIPREEVCSIKKQALKRIVDREINSAISHLKDRDIRRVRIHLISALSCHSILGRRPFTRILASSRVLALLLTRLLQKAKDNLIRRLS